MKSYKQANQGCHYLTMNAVVQMALCIIIIIIIIIFYPRYQGSRGVWKK